MELSNIAEEVLQSLRKQGEGNRSIVINREYASELGIPYHLLKKIVNDLICEGYLTKRAETKDGQIVRTVNEN